MWKGPSKRWEKSYQWPLLCFWSSLFQGLVSTNEQFVYVPKSVVFIVANAILWVQKKFQGFPITATEHARMPGTRPKHRLIRSHTARNHGEFGDRASYHDSVCKCECTKKKTEAMISWKLSEYVKPWLQKQIWPWVIFEGTINPKLLFVVLSSLMPI